MRLDRIWEIAKKDMSSVRKYKFVLYGLVALPFIFAIVLPIATLYPVMSAQNLTGGNIPTLIPPGMSPKQAMVLFLVSMETLMFMFLPAFIPSIIASYTFVGEKVNKQLEPLLATPTTDAELLLGKGLGAFVPTMAVALASFAGMAVTVDLITFPLFGRLLLPNLLSVAILFVCCPLVAILSISWSVFVSSKVNDVRAASQLSGMAIVPVLAFYFLFIGGVVALDGMGLAVFALTLILADAGLFYLSKVTFQREEILTKWK